MFRNRRKDLSGIRSGEIAARALLKYHRRLVSSLLIFPIFPEPSLKVWRRYHACNLYDRAGFFKACSGSSGNGLFKDDEKRSG